MTTMYAALLRGINVGGSRKVPMAELRTLLTALGLDGVRTHLQSGQAVFAAGHGDEDSLAAEITAAIEAHFGFPVDVIVRDHAYLRAVVDDCPFPADTLEGRQLHVTYLSAPADPARYAGIDPAAYAPEEFRLGELGAAESVRGVQVHRPVAEALSRPRLTKGLIATSRNWNTVVKLVELTGA